MYSRLVSTKYNVLFQITMPSGAYLRADYYRNWSNSILYIYLHLSSEDYGKTSGLCGVWNGNPGDDTVTKGTTNNDPRDWPDTFSDSYRYVVYLRTIVQCFMKFNKTPSKVQKCIMKLFHFKKITSI